MSDRLSSAVNVSAGVLFGDSVVTPRDSWSVYVGGSSQPSASAPGVQ